MEQHHCATVLRYCDCGYLWLLALFCEKRNGDLGENPRQVQTPLQSTETPTRSKRAAVMQERY